MFKNFILEKTVLFLLVLKYNSYEIIKDYFFLKKIFKKIFFKKKIVLKVGIDPNNNIIHLGHLVFFNKINQIEKLKFKIILILGGITSLIGDPTGKIIRRYNNYKNNICLNIKYFLCQFKFLINLNKINIYYNQEWLDILNILDLISLLYLITLNKILYRNDFKNRYVNNSPIFLFELIYPVLQSYDSIFIKSDIEIGGFDQKLNFLITRFIQKKIKKNVQIMLLLNLLIGLDGLYKMSKSKLNFLSFKDNFFLLFKKIFHSKFLFYYYKIFSFKKKKYIIESNYYLKKKIIIKNIMNNYINKKITSFFFIKLKYIKFLLIKKKIKLIYKIIKLFTFYSNNKIIFYIKNKSLKINNILIKNFNFILLKGKYLLRIKKKYFFLYLIF